MVLTSVGSVVLSILSVLGLGGILVALTNHWLASRRDSALRERARSDKRYEADLHQVETLDGLVAGLRLEIRPYEKGGTKGDRSAQRQRQRKLAAILNKYRDGFEDVGHALHDDAWLRTSPLGRSKSSYINAVSLKAAQIGSKRRMEEVRRLLGK